MSQITNKKLDMSYFSFIIIWLGYELNQLDHFSFGRGKSALSWIGTFIGIYCLLDRIFPNKIIAINWSSIGFQFIEMNVFCQHFGLGWSKHFFYEPESYLTLLNFKKNFVNGAALIESPAWIMARTGTVGQVGSDTAAGLMHSAVLLRNRFQPSRCPH